MKRSGKVAISVTIDKKYLDMIGDNNRSDIIERALKQFYSARMYEQMIDNAEAELTYLKKCKSSRDKRVKSKLSKLKEELREENKILNRVNNKNITNIRYQLFNKEHDLDLSIEEYMEACKYE